MAYKTGEFKAEDFFYHTQGLNSADSPFLVNQSENTGGYNYDYVRRGGIAKRAGHSKLNSSADTELKSLGIGLFDKPGVAREVVRAAGRKLQNFDANTYGFSNLSEDTTAAGTDFLGASSTQPVSFKMFNTSNAGVLWSSGGGATALYGAYSDSKVTKNGVPEVLVSSFTAVPTGAGGTGTLSTGVYRYGLVFRKASTQALGNAATATEALSATFASGTHNYNRLTWTVSNNDTTKFDKIYIYRSAVNGAAAFTAGALVAIVNSNITTYDDTGSSISSSENVPRAGNTLLDNSELPFGTPKCVALFKRRLVTAISSTVYFSDLNRPESWPAHQTITVPAGSEITALGVISKTTAMSSEIEELLVIFTQREVWVITGDGSLSSGVPNWSLKYISTAGAPNQSVIVAADDYLFWVNYVGVYAWNANGKPECISRKIANKFQRGGDIDKGKLGIAWGVYVEDRSAVQWCLSSNSVGEQKYVLKLDLDATLMNKTKDGIFSQDQLGFAAYAGASMLLSAGAANETVYFADNSGFLYSGYTSTKDGGNFVDWSYETPHLHFGLPNVAKRINKVIAWVVDNGEYDLRLTCWSDYKVRTSEGTTNSLPINQGQTNSGALYGSATYGTSTYNSFSPKVKPVVFNINPGTQNNGEGDAFRLRFSQIGSDKSLTLLGFTVLYTELALRK